MSVIGYHVRVHITQVLPSINTELLINPDTNRNYLINNSWLYDPFGDNSTYGVKFGINNCFSWDFFMYAKKPGRAFEIGDALLISLQERYKGLDGMVEVFPLYPELPKLGGSLYEIILPDIIPKKLTILSKIIMYYSTYHRKVNLDMFILWKKRSFTSRPIPSNPNLYMIKILVCLNSYFGIKQKSSLLRNSALGAALRYLFSEISSSPDQQVSYKLISPSTWKYILLCDVFPETVIYGYELNQPRQSNLKITCIVPDELDFLIPENFPLAKPPIIENRNSINNFSEYGKKNYLFFGTKINEGILSNEFGMIEINSLNRHLNIFGRSGTGKSTVIKIIINEICKKRPDVGILILNLVKPDLEKDFPMAKVYKFPSERFKIPYITIGDRVKKNITGSSSVLAACLGIKNIGPVIISHTFQRCYKEYKEFPIQIIEFFNCVEDNIKSRPYDPDTQKTILTAFRRRIDEFFMNPELEMTLRFNTNTVVNIPEWFLEWRNGDIVLIDLTKLNNKEQHLVSMLIFQMIETQTPFINSNTLKHLIFIDEAHRILGKSRDRDPESAEFIMKNRINDLFSNTIEECRAKGLGLIISDQHPYNLLDSAIDSAGIKILFSLGYPHNKIFTGNLKEREMILNLKERYALVLNGTNGERYLIKTADDIY